MKRFEARLFRLLGSHMAPVARWLLALALLGSGLLSLVSSHAVLGGGPSDFAGQALSIFSNGAIIFETAPKFVGLLEIALALCFAVFPSARLTVFLALCRLVLAIAPLVQLQDALWTRYPTHLNGAGQSAAGAALLFLAVFGFACRERWVHLAAREDVQELLHESVFEASVRRLRWRRFGLVFGPLALLVCAALPFVLPRASQWLHTRQETVALSEVIAGQLIRKSMPPSKFLGGRKITTWVYLPPGYAQAGKRFPVVYVMHGMPGEVRDAFVKGQIQDAAAQLIQSGQIGPVILVGWDGQGPGGPADVTDFLNRPDYPMESFITRELVPYVDRTYKTIPDPRFRALDGISAGGYAAPNLLFKHPDIWRVASSHTGFFSPGDDANNMTDILGPRGPKWDENDPVKNAGRFGPKNDLHLYLDIGRGDDLVPEFKKFVAVLKSRGIDHEAHIFPGRHTWGYWSAHFYDSLKFADERFRAERASGVSANASGAGTAFPDTRSSRSGDDLPAQPTRAEPKVPPTPANRLVR